MVVGLIVVDECNARGGGEVVISQSLNRCLQVLPPKPFLNPTKGGLQLVLRVLRIVLHQVFHPPFQRLFEGVNRSGAQAVIKLIRKVNVADEAAFIFQPDGCSFRDAAQSGKELVLEFFRAWLRSFSQSTER